MAKEMNKYDLKHLSNLTTVQRQVDRVFNAAIQEAARLGAKVGEISPDRLFSFADYPITRKEIETLLDGLKTGLSGVIVNGVRSAWTLANNKNNELSRQVFGDNVGKLSQAQYRRYFSTNGAALDAFLARKENGLNLSDRVWRYTEAFKNEIELGLDVGIRNGLSADEMSRELRQWLQHPDMLFRRVRDEHGQLKLSQRAATFHPGQGVYRSSYKNARRLAATETNIAYRTSDHERWQQLDFVVGIRIVLSNNHTLLGSDGKPHPFTDICDDLAGSYPKDFKFTGWHPLCRCHAVPILKTTDEINRDNQAILQGGEPSEQSVNAVEDVPQGFSTWVKANTDRIETAKSLPYFIRDNKSTVENILKNIGHTSKTEKFSLIGDGNNEFEDDVQNYLLPASVRNNLNYYENLRTYNEFKSFMAERGIRVRCDIPGMESKNGDIFHKAPAECYKRVAVTVDTFRDLFGRDSLKSLKELVLYSKEDISGQAAYFYNMVGEHDPLAGTLHFGSWKMDGYKIFHEFTHVFQDSLKKRGEDAVLFAKRIVKDCNLSEKLKAYFGASADALDAERMADAFGYGFVNGLKDNQGKARLDFIEKVWVYYKSSATSPHYGAAIKLGKSATKKANNIVANIGAPELSEMQKQNIRELADELGINQKEIKPMSFLNADRGASNPLKDKENCQSVVVAFEVRRRGLNVYALPYSAEVDSASYVLGESFQNAWINPKNGKIIKPTIIRGTTDKEILARFKVQTRSDGRYILGINTKDGRGHVLSVERINGELLLKDEQADEFISIDSIDNISCLEIIKIDKALLNKDLVKSVLKFR